MNLPRFNNEDMLLTNFELTWTSYEVPNFTHHYLSSGDCHNSGITEFTILNNIFDHSQCNKVLHCPFFCFLEYEQSLLFGEIRPGVKKKKGRNFIIRRRGRVLRLLSSQLKVALYKMSNFVESRDSHIKLKYRIPFEGLSNLLESSDGAF